MPGLKMSQLKEYGIHPRYGFLPLDPPPLTRLPDYFQPWETLMDHLNALVVAGALRKRIQELPELDVESHIHSDREWERAYVVLSFLAHASIIAMPKADELDPIVPACLAIPWFKVAKHLDLKPVVSYAAVDIFNWYLLDPNGPCDLSNLAMQHTFSGVFDEAWFYLIPLAVEAAGGPSLHALVQAQECITSNQIQDLEHHMTIIADSISEMAAILKRMYEKNDPHIFWNRVRPFFGGSKNSPTLPHGIFYEGVLEVDEHVNLNGPCVKGKVGTWRKYVGASAGQSPLIHSLDVGLSIHHNPMNSGAKENPMMEMRDYLSSKAKAFLQALANGPNIRSFIESLDKSHPARLEYNRAIQNMKLFRDNHLQLATVYIILQQKKDTERSGGSIVGSEGVVGTGGTDLIPFLKQTRNETAQAIVE